jgi:hypothetical protein
MDCITTLSVTLIEEAKVMFGHRQQRSIAPRQNQRDFGIGF